MQPLIIISFNNVNSFNYYIIAFNVERYKFKNLYSSKHVQKSFIDSCN